MMIEARRRKRLIGSLAFVGLLSFAIAALAGAELGLIGGPRLQGTTYDDAPAAPDFVLVNHRGGTSSLSDYRGKAVLLFFGFTRCRDVCPLTLTKLSRVLEESNLSSGQVEILLVTVDPEYDTPEQLARYVEPFGPSITGLTGDPAVLDALYAEYGVYARPLGDEHHSIAHTNQVFGIDADGRLRVLIHADGPDSVISNDTEALLR